MGLPQDKLRNEPSTGKPLPFLKLKSSVLFVPEAYNSNSVNLKLRSGIPISGLRTAPVYPKLNSIERQSCFKVVSIVDRSHRCHAFCGSASSRAFCYETSAGLRTSASVETFPRMKSSLGILARQRTSCGWAWVWARADQIPPARPTRSKLF
jgi:hypothetical protein